MFMLCAMDEICEFSLLELSKLRCQLDFMLEKHVFTTNRICCLSCKESKITK